MPDLTTSQASRTYDAHPGVLHRLIVTGKLDARKNADGHWLISKLSLERWNRNRVRRRRAKNNQNHAAGSGMQ
jgi:hypothetical protein